MEYPRIISLEEISDDSLFLWGPRQVGKSSLLKRRFPHAMLYDLLVTETFVRFERQPSLLREEVLTQPVERIIIIDEVQKVPQLLDEVHWLMVNHGYKFILCGSSARKLRRVGTNLLGGRALKCHMYPLVSAEIGEDFNLNRAINNGLIPRHYEVENPWRRIQAYIGDYLKEEIRIEAGLRNLPAFSRFLEMAAQCDGELIVYNNIAQDCGISAPTAKEYFNILQQTLIGFMLEPFTQSKKRTALQSPRFYYFDVGLTNFLLGRKKLEPGTPEYGHAFEHFVIQEIRAWLGYRHDEENMYYWRTTGGYEVDCVIGEGRVAIEIKSVTQTQSRHLKGLKAFSEDFPNARLIVVSQDPEKRLLNGVEIFPVQSFLKELWAGGI